MLKQSEKEIQNKIILACSKKQTRLFRNNVGAAKLKDGRYIKFGLHKGSSDLIGWKQVVITPEMVGKTFAQFLSVEVKRKDGKSSTEQKNWKHVVNNQGGLSFVARSEEEAIRKLEE